MNDKKPANGPKNPNAAQNGARSQNAQRNQGAWRNQNTQRNQSRQGNWNSNRNQNTQRNWNSGRSQNGQRNWNASRNPNRPRRYRGPRTPQEEPIGLYQAWGLYFFTVFIGWPLGMALVYFPIKFFDEAWAAVIALLGVYPACGLILNRRIFNRLFTWNRYTASLSDRARGKLWVIFMWPLAYPVLLFQLGISRL